MISERRLTKIALGVTGVALALSSAACDSTETVKTVTVEQTAAPGSVPTSPSRPKQAKQHAPSYRSCDPNIEARVDTTTCAFAQNVFWVYWTNGEISPISVYSPAVQRSFRVRCANDGVGVTCTSRDGSGVRFPMAALDAYSQGQADAYAADHDLGPDPYEETLSPDESYDSSDYLDDPPDDEDYYGDYDDSAPYPDDSSGDTLPGENIPNYDNGRGYRVQCDDGTYSQSGGIQGACSHHGGVAP
jgi:hypothetical protein